MFVLVGDVRMDFKVNVSRSQGCRAKKQFIYESDIKQHPYVIISRLWMAGNKWSFVKVKVDKPAN